MVAFVMRRVLLFNESGCLWGMLRSISLNPRPAGFALLGGGGVHSIPKTAVKAAKVKEVDSHSALVWTTSQASQTERPFLSVFCSCRSFAGPWVCCFPWLSVCVCVCVCAKSLQTCCLTLCNPVDCSPPPSMGFSRREYWSELPCPPGDLLDPGIESMYLTSNLHWQAGSLLLVLPGKLLVICILLWFADSINQWCFVFFGWVACGFTNVDVFGLWVLILHGSKST